MDIFEFELRYKAYAGLSRLVKLGRNETDIIDMVAITNKGKPKKAIQEILPDELKTLTKDTYTLHKKNYIKTHNHFSKNFGKEEFFHPLSEYIERLEYELKVIKEMGFNTYMLVVSDFTTRAKQNSIMVGPGRGSGAGSLLAFLISITDINPFAYDLLFERFLNPARISMPDFDIDFEDTLREEVIHYVANKYGHDHVSAIGTYMTMATKAAFKDAARAIGIPFDRSNDVTKLMDDLPSLKLLISEDESVNKELLTLYKQDKNIQEAVVMGAQLEKNLRQLGVHACGMIISPAPVTEYTATQIINKGGIDTLVTQYDGPTLEHIGLLKMDFLGLRNLSIIKNCIKILRAKYKNLTPETVTTQTESYFIQDKHLFDEFIETMSFHPDINNKEVFEKVFMAGDTTGIFQFEGDGMRRFLVDLQANHINDLVAMNALYRPGPIEFIPTYIRRKHGEEEINYMLPELKTLLLSTYNGDMQVVNEEQRKLEEDLKPIMDVSYGIAVYQEQLMFLVQAMAGFSLPEADLLRRGVAKKKKEIIDQLKSEFTKRAQSYRNYKPETAKMVYEKMIEPAASYSFNKSHSVCYAHIAYQDAYLKARYPLEFYASLLRSVEEDTDRLAIFIDEVRAHNIRLTAPHINKAYNHIAALDNSIIMGFYACKGIGFEIGEQIEAERTNNGLFTSLENVLERCPFIANKRTLESLIKAGAFDERYDRNTLLVNISNLVEWHTKINQLDQGLFGSLSGSQKLQFQKIMTTSIIEKSKYDVEIFKNMISGHPLDGLYLYTKKFGLIAQVKNQSEATPFSCAAMIKKITRARKKGFFVLVEDVTDSFEFFIKDIIDLKVYDIVLVEGYKSKNRKINTMIKISIEEFIERAKKANKYDEQRTVARVRAERRDGAKPQVISTISLENDEVEEVIETSELKEQDSMIQQIGPQFTKQGDSVDNGGGNKDIDNTISTPNQVSMIKLPNSLETIKTIGKLVISHPGSDHTIEIHGEQYQISTQGMNAIQQLLDHQ